MQCLFYVYIFCLGRRKSSIRFISSRKRKYVRNTENLANLDDSESHFKKKDEKNMQKVNFMQIE